MPLEDLDVVNPSLLVPPDLPIRGGWRTDAGVVLDRELVGLAAMHARCRLVQARLARRLIERRAWTHLGFVRLGDYARERLGLAPRTIEDDARVHSALERLPHIRFALESGAITWTRARVLVRVARTDNEARLLEESGPVALRELEAFARDFAAREAPGVKGPLPAGAAAQPECKCVRVAPPREFAEPDDDPIVRWGIAVSRGGRRLWRGACELASRMAGSPLSPGQVLELVAAEASGECAGGAWVPPAEVHERRLRDRLRRREERGRRCLLAFLAETGVAEGFPWLAPASRAPGPAVRLDELLAGLDHTDAFEIDRRLRALRAAAQRVDFQMAALLHVGINRHLFRELGFASVKLYAESRLGISARTVWSLVAIERECWRRCPPLRSAWRDGRLSHLAAAALLPVISESHAEAWIRRAGEVTLRRLQDEVAWALDHGAQPSAITRPGPPAADADVRADGTGDVGLREVQMRAHAAATECPLGPPGAVRVECSVPLSVAVLVETTLDRVQRDRDARWQTFERMIACALLEWRAQPRHRDPVFDRDGWRCSVPGCSSRRNLHDHHVMFRSHGGENGLDNRTTVCAGHHLHGIHTGIVRARGRAPSRIVWELGCARGRRPLMRLVGDRLIGQNSVAAAPAATDRRGST